MDIPSKEVMERDLANTDKEIGAYCKILNGYLTLQRLPETPSQAYKVEVIMFEYKLKECRKFYKEIKKTYDDNYGKEKWHEGGI